MTIDWHCRGCNEQATQVIDVSVIVKNRKPGEPLLEVLQRLTKHECENKNIGVKVHVESVGTERSLNYSVLD